jgi:hypothetical protein
MATPQKIDVLKLHRADYAAPRQPVLLEIGPATYLAIRGRGRPGDRSFVQQIGALYGVAFTTKMQRKFDGRGDYTIGKLEARWPGPPPSATASAEWELLIRTPEAVTHADVERARATLRTKDPRSPVDDVQLTSIDEGYCVQLLHVGAYDEEPRTMAAMTAFAARHHLEPHGAHHEIYLSDPRRVPPERLRTILRLPVAPVKG